jgi:murein hydrolase activator
MKFRLLLVALAVALAGGTNVPAQKPTAAPPPRSAAALQERLKALKAESEMLTRQQSTLLVELRRLDVDRQVKATELEQTTDAIATIDQSMAETGKRITQTNTALEAVKPAIRERVVRVYKLGRLGYARLLLDLQEARTFQRTARVVSLLARRDRAQLDRHQQLLTTLKQEQTRLGSARQTARDLQGRLAREQQALATAIAVRAARVKEIAERRDLNQQLAAELTAAQARLNTRVGQLTATTMPGLPGKVPTVGRFDWPIAGRVQSAFGRQQTSRFGTMIARNGIEIEAQEGSEVKAIGAGKVAYADVFSGFGQLVILDHGEKTYSLYGHLSALSVQRGGSVERGQVVGSSGASPAGAPAVYFELRIDGKPVDPVQWLKR